MTLIDTSAWIHSLRSDGDMSVRARVAALLESGEAAWCPMVRLELWNGARGAHEHRVLADLQGELPELAIDTHVWTVACDLAKKARSKGKTVPSTDILVAACARHHHVEIEHADSHFDVLSGIAC